MNKKKILLFILGLILAAPVVYLNYETVRAEWQYGEERRIHRLIAALVTPMAEDVERTPDGDVDLEPYLSRLPEKYRQMARKYRFRITKEDREYTFEVFGKKGEKRGHRVYLMMEKSETMPDDAAD